MVFTFCTSGAIVIAAGKNCSSTASTSAAILQQFSNDAEGEICMTIRYDFITNYSSCASYAKLALAQAASAHAGIALAKYDPSSYLSTTEFANIVNVLYDKYYNGIAILKQYKKPEDSA